MIKILFICHGRILTDFYISDIIEGSGGRKKEIYPNFTPFTIEQ